MARYLSKVRIGLEKLNKWAIKRISHSENTQDDALAGIDATLPIKKVVLLPVYLHIASSIVATPVYNTIEVSVGWMNEIKTYL